MSAGEGWRSKANWEGKAHFVLADGRTACADRMGPRGVQMGDLMKTEWTALRSTDHLCTWCRQKHPRQCECGVCRIEIINGRFGK